MNSISNEKRKQSKHTLQKKEKTKIFVWFNKICFSFTLLLLSFHHFAGAFEILLYLFADSLLKILDKLFK